jgi:hypothetical protein
MLPCDQFVVVVVEERVSWWLLSSSSAPDVSHVKAAFSLSNVDETVEEGRESRSFWLLTSQSTGFHYSYGTWSSTCVHNNTVLAST